MRTVPVGRAGKYVALVDDDDYAKVAQFTWTPLRSSTGVIYAARTSYVKGRPHFMHHLCIERVPGYEVDHLDGDGLNNQKANLRLATHSQNLMNARRRNPSKIGFRGVRRNGDGWLAILQSERALRKQTSLGTYDTPEDAARAYDRAAIANHGEFAWTNEKAGLLPPDDGKAVVARASDHHLRGASMQPKPNRYKGVYPQKGRFYAKIMVDRKSFALGGFDNPHLAALAYNEGAIAAWGHHAVLNVVPQEWITRWNAGER